MVTSETPLAPVYLDVTNTLSVSAETFAAFDLTAGASIELEVVTKDGLPLRFELLGLRGDGTTELLGAFHVDSGFALTSLVAAREGRFVLHFPAVAAPHEVVVHIECKGDGPRCGPAQKAGEACMLARDCADGLLCYPVAGACNADLMGGTCAAPIHDAACDGQPRVPVCGCDGRTYDNACLALAAGVGVTKNCALEASR